MEKVLVNMLLYTWQPLGPLLKVKLLVGYIDVKSHDQLKGAGCSGIRRSPDRCAKVLYIYGFGAFSGPPRFGESAKVLLMSYSLS